jgi:hypothetical protein
MSPVVLEDLLDQLSKPILQHAPEPLSFHEIGYGYRTGRSFWFSILLHELVLIMVVFSGRYGFVRSVKAVPLRLETAQLLDVEKVLYLPTLGGGSEGAGKQGGGSGSEPEVSQGVRARGRRGFAYPGPQPMISDPPRATLGIQTILQPSLKNPPLLRQYLPLPNVAQPELAAPEPPKPVLKVLAGKLALRPSEQKPIEAPKITLPLAAAGQVPALDATESIVPRPLPTEPAVPDPPEIHEVAVNRTGQKGLLVLNAVPLPPDVPRNTPAAEARSLFAVTPEEATVIADPGAGSKGGSLPSTTTGVGTPADVASGDALAEAASGGGNKNSSGSGSGSGGHYGSGKGSGLNRAGEGAGTGRGTTAGTGTGSGAGATLGSGKGSGSAPGGGGFPGITISGGRYGTGDAGSLRPSLTPHSQASYGMTITSTASSGGGLPDFGVFQNEKVYTVYLDMRANDEDKTPSWTLQYAVMQPEGAETSDRIRGTPTPPYATLKQVPEFTAAQVSKYARQFVVTSAILNIEGRLEHVSVKQTPDPDMVDLLTEALKNWTFEPARIAGKPVALKILLGIRLSRR